jgi:nitroreductase/NAD-dependent dihydropyrimidine dehydrogenase PreA subunit
MDSIVDTEICSKCKFCIEVCPCNIIGLNAEDKVHFIEERTSICQKCGQCMAVCSTRAIRVDGLTYEDDLVDLPESSLDYHGFMDFLANRRSVRNFKNKPVPYEIIEQILDSVSYAPFGAEPEKVKITVVNNRKKIEAALPYMAEFLDNIVKWIENPVASFMIRRKRSPETFNTLKNHLYPISKLENYKLKFGDRITRGAPAIIIFHAEKGAEQHTNNSMIYATYTILAAHALGLGASMLSLVPAAINKVKEVKKIFRIPEENEAVISVIIGYPKFKYKRAIIRKRQTIDWID